MPTEVKYGRTTRMSFARHEEIQSMPNLLEIQKNSYQWFLTEGLRDVFRDFPPLPITVPISLSSTIISS